MTISFLPRLVAADVTTYSVNTTGQHNATQRDIQLDDNVKATNMSQAHDNYQSDNDFESTFDTMNNTSTDVQLKGTQSADMLAHSNSHKLRDADEFQLNTDDKPLVDSSVSVSYSRMGPGVIAGIVILVLGIITLIAILIWYFLRQSIKKSADHFKTGAPNYHSILTSNAVYGKVSKQDWVKYCAISKHILKDQDNMTEITAADKEWCTSADDRKTYGALLAVGIVRLIKSLGPFVEQLKLIKDDGTIDSTTPQQKIFLKNFAEHQLVAPAVIAGLNHAAKGDSPQITDLAAACLTAAKHLETDTSVYDLEKELTRGAVQGLVNAIAAETKAKPKI